MRTLKATGEFSEGQTPTLSISGGAGDRTAPQVHIIFRESDDENTRTVGAWFRRDELLEAINEASPRQKNRILEPAA